MIRTFKTHTHLKISVVRLCNCYVFHIGTIVVVEKRAVIGDQSHVCLVEAKDIFVNDLGTRNVSRQKQSRPECRQLLIHLERTSCKYSETSCSESRRKF